jgi:hypothetical protein
MSIEPLPGEAHSVRKISVLGVGFALAVFGPYVGGFGLRTEQLAAYLLPIAVLGFSRREYFPRLEGLSTWVFLIFAFSLAATVIPPPLNLDLRNAYVSEADNLLLPLALLFSIPTINSRVNGFERSFKLAVIAFAGMNGVVSLLQSLDYLSGSLQLFWTPSGSSSVAELAATSSRYSGIFNQPAEAGIVYAVALVILATGGGAVSKAVRTLTLAGIITGGVLCASKIFLLVGVPVAVFSALSSSKRSFSSKLASGLAIPFVCWITWVVFGNSSSVGFILGSVFESDQGVLSAVTAGRVGGQTTLLAPVMRIFGESPLVGTGLRGIVEPVDNAFVYALVLGGLVGVILFTVLYERVLRILWRRNSSTEMKGMGAVILLASVGIPALTANRVSTVLWTLISIYAGKYSIDPNKFQVSETRTFLHASNSA